ncbi:(2Fe-2S) ferredoxin domain-containing protein [Ancylobacter sp. IITR112]|uniref:(2Fe-2S) ferredoxin domain-containing protein n=1 Tax=Ancylobacter sp. IITR112 TaxID=3138073 RepID=UPI00352A9889
MKPIKADWTDVVLVCRKCAKKLDGGFGPDADQPLPKALRAAIAARKGGKPMKKPRRKGAHVAVVEVPCLDICPKNAVVVIPAGRPGRWLSVERGTELDALLDTLAPAAEPA